MEVTTALFETALMWVSYHAMGYFGTGEVPQPQGSGTAMIAPYQAFPTADGYVMIGAGSDALFAASPRPSAPGARARSALRRQPLARAQPSRRARRGAVGAHARAHKTAELLERLRAAGVPERADPLDGRRCCAEPQTKASGMLVGAAAPPAARLPQHRPADRWDGARPEVRRVPPRLGEHSADVLTWLGYTLDDVRTLQPGPRNEAFGSVDAESATTV